MCLLEQLVVRECWTFMGFLEKTMHTSPKHGIYGDLAWDLGVDTHLCKTPVSPTMT